VPVTATVGQLEAAFKIGFAGYKLKDGREVKVRNTGPWTWMIQEYFQVNAAGKISQVEAVLLSVPYGTRPGWVTGVHLPSPQAKLDHFREY